MKNLDPLFKRLARSKFRSSFKLDTHDICYLHDQGLPRVIQHAEDIIRKRLSSALIANDGKQTPMRGHPVFVAQHATACCCRGCLQKWHDIPAGKTLTEEEISYILMVLERWLGIQYALPFTPIMPQDPQRDFWA